MGRVLHGSAKTTEAVRRAIQNSRESLRALWNDDFVAWMHEREEGEDLRRAVRGRRRAARLNPPPFGVDDAEVHAERTRFAAEA